MSADTRSAAAPVFEQLPIEDNNTHAARMTTADGELLSVHAYANTEYGAGHVMVMLVDDEGALHFNVTHSEAEALGRELRRAAGVDDGCGACGDACKSRGGSCQLDEDSPPVCGAAQDAAAINAQLLDALCNMVETFRPNASGSDGNRTDALNDAERAIAAAEAQGGSAAQSWIPVSERLPEDRSNVVFYSDDLRNPTRMLLGLYVDGRWMSCGYEMVNVTHWMPKPDAPAAAEGK